MLKKRKMLTVILIFLFCVSTTSAYADTTVQIIGNGNTVTFNDLKGYGWASDAINSFVSQGIVKGDGSGQFKPAEKVTREQFAKMLTLTFNAPLSAPSVATFADVPTSRWSNTYIETSKDFLTGYSNPFGGLPSFHPAEYATREDIAVALVRILGLTDESAQDSSNVSYRFSDASEISNGLIGYVSIAAERNLISGYNDGTFRPQQGITRAEAVVLLNRATKQAVTTLNGDLKVSAEVIKGTEPKNVTLQIKAEEGTKITVDGTAVTMKNNGFGGYEGTYPYTFSSESSKTFTVIGTKAGKTKTVTATATYQIDAPILTISYCPSEINNKNITLTGSITDKKYSTTLTINGELVDKSSQGMTANWYWPCTLKEGQNTLNFVLTSSSGKTTTQTKTITYKVGGPELTITNCPSEISDKNVVLRGTMYDKDYSTVLKINGTDVSTSSAGNNSNWNWTYTLKEGENTLNFILTSSSGKTTTQTKTILYKVGGPELTFTYCPSQVSDKKVDIKGTIYDKDYSAVLTVNGKEVSSTTAGYKNNWNCAYTLDEGENTLNFVVTSDSGKTTSQTKTITYSVKDPKLNISYCPATVSTDSVTIRGSIYDEFYSTVLTINGSEVTTSSSGDNENWEQTYTLKEGENNFNFILTSGSGKTVTETKTIIYKPESSDPIAQ